jgi:hypothetical protein
MENKPTGRGRGSTGANRAGHGGSGRCWAGAQRGGSGRGPSGTNPTGSGRGSWGAYRGDSSGRLGAIPKTSASSSQLTWRERPSSSTTNQPFRGTSRGRGNGLNLSQHPRQAPRQANHRRLDFQYLVKLASENVEPSVVIRCLGDPENDFAQHLKENLGNFDYLEHVIVALGGFCKKNGTSQFSESFVSVVRILEAQNIFQHISSIIINIPVSRVANLPVAKEERLKRLTTAVFHLATEMLVMMPAFSCQCLGQHFLTNIIALQAMPSIKALNVVDAFNVFEAGGIQQLEVSFNNSKFFNKVSW